MNMSCTSNDVLVNMSCSKACSNDCCNCLIARYVVAVFMVSERNEIEGLSG